MKDNKVRIVVEIEPRDDGRVQLSVGQLPHEEVTLTFSSMAKMLGGAIVMLTRLSEKECGVKDHELMKEIIDNMSSEFASTDSFCDAELFSRKNS